MRTTRNFFQELHRLLASESVEDRGLIINEFVQQRYLSVDDFKTEVSFLENDSDKEIFAREWIKKQIQEITLEDLQGVLDLFTNKLQKSNLARTWLDKDGRTLEDLKFALPFVTDDWQKFEVAETWLDKDGRTLADLQGVLDLFADEQQKSNLARTWLDKDGRTLEDLQGVLDLFADEHQKSYLASTWLDKDGRTLEDLKFALPFVTDDWQKFEVAETWLDKDGRTLEDLQGVLDLFAYFQQKSDLAKNWLNKETNPDTKYDKLVILAQSGAFCTRYNIEKIVSMYSEVNLPADKIGGFCKDLYPLSENLQSETFGEFVRVISPQSLSEAKQNLASFVKSLKSDDYALQALNDLKTKIGLTPLEVLEISKDRLSEKYQSIEESLNKNTLLDSVTEEGVKTLNDLFGSIPQNTRVSDIFSYYDINQQLPLFASLLKPEIVTEIDANFSPSEKSAYVSKEEFSKLKHSVVPNLDLPRVGVIGDYLDSRVTPEINASPLSEEKIQNFKFGASESLENILLSKNSFEESKEDSPNEAPKELEDFANEFKNLLREPDPSPENVASFFERALGLDEAIKENNKDKLTNFFKSNKQLLVLLFEKNAGLDNFALAIRSLGDGCVANIATQAKNATYQILLEDSPVDQALFGVFNEKISTPILNSGGDHLTGSPTGINIFTDRFIAQNYISLSGLVKALIEEFCGDNKINRSSGALLYKELGEEKTDEITEYLIQKDPKNINTKIAEIAAYTILKKALPEILKNKYLANFKNSVEEILDSETLDISDINLNEEIKSPDSILTPNSQESSQLTHQSTRGRNNN